MANALNLCGSMILSVVMIFAVLSYQCYAFTNNTFIVSSFNYPEATLKMSEWRYIRVELPQWFSSMSVALESNVNLDASHIEKVPKSTLPLICFRDGSFPLPDVSNTSMKSLGSLSNISLGVSLANTEHCYPLQKNMSLRLTNEQISPGVWYFGIFNGIGATRTQSKMINRGPRYSFNTNISVEGCATSTMWGPYCNQTVEPLPCVLPDGNTNMGGANGTVGNVVSCTSSARTYCHEDSEPRIYSLEVLKIAEQLSLSAKPVRPSAIPSNNTGDVNGIKLMCFARHGAMPSVNLYDYNASIEKDPLVILSPTVGRWYFAILPVSHSGSNGEVQNSGGKLCYSLESQVYECPLGKAGPNCTWEKYMLQTYLRLAVPFQSYYLPVSDKVPGNDANFVLEPLLSNSSDGRQLSNAWTYFLLGIPHGAAGGNIHIQLTSKSKIPYEIYARFGGMPSVDVWDYYYANKSRSSGDSVFFRLYNSSEGKIDFHILYVKEGTWSLGIRQMNSPSSLSKDQTTISISVERCPNRCSSHGQCKTALDASGLTSYSYCDCDRTHGGFDCGVEIVSHRGHVVQSIFLVASNAAAILPAFWALRNKDLAEWVVFTSSGISSALYHACDVGTRCVLSFNALQFMDFWLSFMAVVSTFIYLTTIDEVSKRAIHTAVAILTALLAISGATRSSNIILVLAIGAFGLVVGWVMEFSTNWRQYSFSLGCLNMLQRWDIIKVWLRNVYKTFRKRYHWGFLLGGFAFFAIAASSWIIETSKTYWIWHSIWHVSIYTSSFFFLCSKAKTENSEDPMTLDRSYELTRQNSFPRAE